MIGKTVSHYNILEKLGEGGMGVVYKSEDTKLNRTVALKFLPTNKLGTGEEKQRFEQEAKAAAQLNHANIATIHEINEHEGETFIAMEYIAGETISDMVKTKPLKIKDAIKVAKQIAEGLHSAHEVGIVHRDIKSANIMLTKKGVVKIMDFGLAKMSKASMLTKAGTTLGTISYMSPEQSQGEKVDHRADIWSLGIVFYEMISGQLPFKGEYESAIIYSIMNEDPEPLTAVRTGVPIDLEKIVNKLLAKEPDERYQNIVELPVDLKNVSLQETDTSQIGSSVISGTMNRKKEASSKRFIATLMPWAITALLTAGLIASMMFRPSEIAMPLTGSLVFDGDAGPVPNRHLALSPDGMQLAYVTSSRFDGARLWIRNLADGSMEPLEGTEGAERPFWSPNGTMIGYFAKDELRAVSVRGGASNSLAPAPGPRGGAWSDQGVILYSPVNGPLFKIPASGGTPTQVTQATSMRKGEFHRNPVFLPGGRQFLFWLGRGDQGYIYKGDLETGKIEQIREGGNPTYVKSGFLVFRLGVAKDVASVFAQRFDPEQGVLSGQPLHVKSNLMTPNGSAVLSVNNRTIVFYPRDQVKTGLPVWQSRKGELIDSLAHKENTTWVHRVSHDGTRVAFAGWDLWVHDLTRDLTVRIPTQKSFPIYFAWSPEDSRIIYSWLDEMRVVHLTDISGEEVIYQSDTGNISVSDWSPDGQTILFICLRDGSRIYNELWAFDTSSGKATQVLDGSYNVFSAQFAPNGRWFAYSSDEGGENSDVYLRPFPGPGALIRISVGGGAQPRWCGDGSELFYVNGEGRLVAVQVGFGAEPSVSGQAVIPGNPINHYDVHPDGQRFLLRPQHREDNVRLTILRDWVGMLEERQ